MRFNGRPACTAASACRAEPKGETKLCTISLNSRDIDHFHNAIEELYYFEFFVCKRLAARLLSVGSLRGSHAH